MRVSVVVCTHTTDRYPDLREAVESVLANTYEDREVVVVSDGSEAVYDRAVADFGDHPDVRVHLQPENRGLLAVRNTGARVAEGDVVAFLDDDAIAEDRWLVELVAAYDEGDARADDGRVLAAGGRVVPAWVAGEPAFLPEEFHWLIGVTHRGFADGPGEVRNTNGSNISFRADVFEELGGFDTDVGGRKGDNHLQGGETELCARLREEFGVGVQYNPAARVAHKIFDYRTDPRWLVERAFWQGYSKRGMEKFVPESTGEEEEFLGDLLLRFVPDRVRGLLLGPSLASFLQLVFLFVLTGAVGAGYLYGIVKWR
ncbi:glucosyl-dolichyl phosphate glucuronosyltransferase [Halomarina litorea]|uniref:glucosyl-dolichyl phosphate glucuronosyltransferase n=1 Tax=Halomarina litorea TaxID=2961595 RepID=UPI0020C27E36|nr:glucosyl-dolichyl phosphate glucuronosyltransferase [Halomarina sp. BCD28]